MDGIEAFGRAGEEEAMHVSSIRWSRAISRLRRTTGEMNLPV